MGSAIVIELGIFAQQFINKMILLKYARGVDKCVTHFICRHEVKRPLKRDSRRWEDIIKMYIKIGV
jgi:hypothetical protein